MTKPTRHKSKKSAAPTDNQGSTKQSSPNNNYSTEPGYTIDPEFQSVLPAKTPEQYEALKESIRSDGKIREPLVVAVVEGKRFLADHQRSNPELIAYIADQPRMILCQKK
jgi:hypothetical protein